jgi:minor extracellular serine protease Vpr
MRLTFPRAVRFGALLALGAAVVVPIAVAGSTTALGDVQAEGAATGLWFVEMNGAPTAAGGSAAAVKAEKAAFRAAAKKAGVSFKERLAFDRLWNGLSIQTGADAATLRSINGVKSVSQVGLASIPPTQTVSPELATAIHMTGADIAQSSLGLDGTGVKVGVVDTGFDLDHPDLGGDNTAGAPYTNSRVVAQFDFVGDAYNADPASASYDPTPTPDPIADDCNGHGTHVSGIIGANGGATGVAPGVTFGAYRVFGCGGSANDDVILAALEQAYVDGMDVVNMSLGDAFNSWPQAPLAQASDTLLKNGVVVVASIGNSGLNGVYSNGAPGVGDGVIGVASYDNTNVNLNAATVTPLGLTVGYQNASGVPAAPFSGSLPLAKANAIGVVPTGPLPDPGPLPNDDGCAVVAAGTYTGKAVLIRRGTCGFYQKAKIAEDGGAAAVILYNRCLPQCGRFGANAAGVPAVTIPVVSVSDQEGVAIHNAIASGTPQTWNWTTGTLSLPNPTGGTISDFSSFGLNAELTLKPDIGAPGGLIRSTYPLEAGRYATISGTSMASPHVAGAVALLLEAHPGVDRRDVRDVLQNSADPKIRFGQTYLDNVHRQGAGMLDVDDAILATTLLQPGKISLGEGNGGTETIKLTNASGTPVTYDLSHEAAAGTTNTFAPVAYSTDYASATFSSPSVTVPGHGSANVQVTITPNPAMPEKGVYGGYITFTPQGDGQEYRVPYAGFKGDYQSIQVLTSGGAGLPLLGKLTTCSPPAILRGSECFSSTGAGIVFTPPAPADPFTFVAGLGETPMFLTHFDHQARSLTAEVYRASDDTWMGTAFTRDYQARNSTATNFFALPWDGDAKKGNGNSFGNAGPVADGTYYVKFELIKALGTTQDAETWTSPSFIIDRA